jgi:8-oxo-dGTP diphosphatase
VDRRWGDFENEELNDPEKCILRELSEETGIYEKDIADLKLKYITIRRYKEEIRQQYIYFARLINKNIRLAECDEGILEWVALGNILN